MITALLAILFLLVGLFGGWFAAEKYMALVALNMQEPHAFEHLFENNPHPEIFEEDGTINRGDYIFVDFPPGFDPSDMADYTITEIDDEDWED